MKIKSAKVIVTCPGRNFVTLKIVTDEGVHGLGDATLNGREKAVVAYLEDHVIPCLIGRDPHRIEDIWQYLYKGAYWRRGPVTMTAIAAVDILKQRGVKNIHFCCLIASPEGVARLSEAHPDIAIHTTSVDEKLNEIGYIIPGLGDAGDRAFNTMHA